MSVRFGVFVCVFGFMCVCVGVGVMYVGVCVGGCVWVCVGVMYVGVCV